MSFQEQVQAGNTKDVCLGLAPSQAARCQCSILRCEVGALMLSLIQADVRLM